MTTKVKGAIQVRLDADRSAPQRARRAVETLGDRLDARTVGDLRAVVSELVAIYLSAPEKPIEVKLELPNEHVRGEVRCFGGVSGEISGGGHALRIIGAFVEEWGITTDHAVWFEML